MYLLLHLTYFSVIQRQTLIDKECHIQIIGTLNGTIYHCEGY